VSERSHLAVPFLFPGFYGRYLNDICAALRERIRLAESQERMQQGSLRACVGPSRLGTTCILPLSRLVDDPLDTLQRLPKAYMAEVADTLRGASGGPPLPYADPSCLPVLRCGKRFFCRPPDLPWLITGAMFGRFAG